MSERARSRVAVALLLMAVSVTSAHALDATPLAASHFGTGTGVLLALSVAAVALTLFLNPFGAPGFVAFAVAGLANTVFLVRSSLADRTELVAGSIVGFVALIVIASYRNQERIAETRAKEDADFRERQAAAESSRDPNDR
jgi:uncharacterized membrane protein